MTKKERIDYAVHLYEERYGPVRRVVCDNLEDYLTKGFHEPGIIDRCMAILQEIQ
jgi:hypothetical protein